MSGAYMQPQQSGAERETFEDIKAFSDAEAQLFADEWVARWALWNGSEEFSSDDPNKTKQPSISSEETYS